MYHKSYEQRNPIEVNIRSERIEVLSFPGPLPPVDNQMLKQKRIVSRMYRNRRIGDFLKELNLTEGRATGFPKIYDAMHKNGSPEPVFETDNQRSYFLAILRAHPDMKERGEAGGEANQISLNDTEKAILKYLKEGPCSADELANELGLKRRSGFLTRTLRRLIKYGFIEYLYPATPRHPDQKYKLKEK